jgi:hypothetical protein
MLDDTVLHAHQLGRNARRALRKAKRQTARKSERLAARKAERAGKARATMMPKPAADLVPSPTPNLFVNSVPQIMARAVPDVLPKAVRDDMPKKVREPELEKQHRKELTKARKYALKEERKDERRKERRSRKAQILRSAVSADATITASEIAAIAALVSEKTGQSVTYLRSEQVALNKWLHKNRRYFSHVFSSPGLEAELTVFTKPMPSLRLQEIESFLASVECTEFRAPTFYGTATSENELIGVWEFVTGRTPKFVRMSHDEVDRIARAVGAMNAITDEALRRLPDLPVGTKSIGPVANPLRAAMQGRSEPIRLNDDTRRALDQLDALEGEALARLNAIGDRFFSHQDMAGGNLLIVPPNEDLVILDWETASIAAPGASLRRLAVGPIELQEAGAGIYVDYMRGRGYSLEARDVLFVIGATQVFRCLNWGLQRLGDAPERASKSIRWGLEHVSEYLGRA